MALQNGNEYVYIYSFDGVFLLVLAIEIEHYLLSVLRLYFHCLVRCIESFFLHFADVGQGHRQIQELFVLVAAHTHAVESGGLVPGGENDEALFGYADNSLYDS